MNDWILLGIAIIGVLMCPIIFLIGLYLQNKKENKELKKKEEFIAEIEARETKRKYFDGLLWNAVFKWRNGNEFI